MVNNPCTKVSEVRMNTITHDRRRKTQGTMMMRTSLLLCGFLAGAVSMAYGADAEQAAAGRDNEGIAIWGHSMPADITPARLAAALLAVGAANPGRPIVNQSVGGSGTFNSLLRQGAIAWTTEVAGGVIPGEGRVELTNHRSPVFEEKLGAAESAQIMAEIRWSRMQNTWVEIGGVIGQFAWDKDRSADAPPFFQRREAGEAVRVKNPIDVRMLAVGPDMAHDLKILNRYLNILWGPGYRSSFSLEENQRYMIGLVQASLDRMSARDKRLIIIEGMPFTALPASAKNIQDERLGVERARKIYQENFPNYYFDYVAASLTGLGPAPAAREWLAKTHPELFRDPDWGWEADLDSIPNGRYAGGNHTGREKAAVAELRLTGNGGRGVKSAARVRTETPGATRWVKTGLFVGVEAEDGSVVRLTVHEGGRGYAVGDRVVIPAGEVGNAAPITGEVAAIREESIGTVRHPDGTVDVAHSYSQWDVDNGYWPRCFRRDFIHLNAAGAEYLSLLLAARIEQLGW
jgi:hypothetical protein